MGRWRNINLSTKIFILLALMVLVILGGGMTTVWYAREFNDLNTSIIEREVSALRVAGELETALVRQKGFATYYFLDGDSRWLEQLEQHRRSFENRLQEARKYADSDIEKEIIDRIESDYIDYVKSKNQVISLYRSGNSSNGESLHWEVREKFFNIQNLCGQYVEIHDNQIADAKQKSREKAESVYSFVAAVMVASLLLGLVFVSTLTTQVLAPIRRLSNDIADPESEKESTHEMAALSSRVHGIIEDRDRTKNELEQSRERLLESEKMAMVGKLAAEVAHSIRNPMTSIKMRLFSLQRSLELNSNQKEDIEVVSEEMRRLDNIVRNFLEFSRPHKLKKQRTNVCDIVDLSIDLLEYRLTHHEIEVVHKSPSELPEITADPELLKEVIVNLIVNSCEAMERGGRILISEEEAAAEKIGIAVIIRVKDTGPGIPSSISSSVLEPFFSTKPNGTGLGLSVAVRIVEEHGGRLEMTSNDDEGATFAIILPACEEV